MTDYSVNIPRERYARPDKTEYRIYFALIFLAALPFGLAGWLISPWTPNARRQGTPFKRALAEARAITPMIFRA